MDGSWHKCVVLAALTLIAGLQLYSTFREKRPSEGCLRKFAADDRATGSSTTGSPSTGHPSTGSLTAPTARSPPVYPRPNSGGHQITIATIPRNFSVEEYKRLSESLEPATSKNAICTAKMLHALTSKTEMGGCKPEKQKGVAKVRARVRTRGGAGGKVNCGPNLRKAFAWFSGGVEVLFWHMMNMKLCPPGPQLVVEIGVEKGSFTAGLAKGLGKQAGCQETVFVLVEADPDSDSVNRAKVLANLKAQGDPYHLVTAFAGAMDREPRTYCYRTRAEDFAEKQCQGIAVQQITLDTAVRQAPPAWKAHERPIAFLKIDAEGYDASILYGAPETLRRVKVLLFEHQQAMNPPYLTSLILKEHGFDLFFVGLNVFLRISPDYLDASLSKVLPFGNMVAVRPGHPVHDYMSARVVCL
eukprot:Hpha_TRINITY_DN13747_c0_g2::TRINITY_DN13747_c0_g2_i1::g.142234::m.142234